MFDWLFEGRLAIYLVLVLVAVVCLVLWWQRRERRLLQALAGVVALGILYFLLSFVRETDSEQITRKLSEMAVAVDKRQVNRLLEHVSEDFRAYGMDRKKMQTETESALSRFDVRDARILDLSIKSLDRNARKATILFRGSASNNRTGTRLAIPCEADFVLDKDGQWRMKEIRFYKPLVDNLEPWNPFNER